MAVDFCQHEISIISVTLPKVFTGVWVHKEDERPQNEKSHAYH